MANASIARPADVRDVGRCDDRHALFVCGAARPSVEDAGRFRDIRAAVRSALPVGPTGSASTKWKRSGVLKRSSRSFAHLRKSRSLKLRSRATTIR
jgi:hypothetical protein